MKATRPPASGCARGGFTLIELMIAVVVLGIMAGLAAPRMTAYLNFNFLDQTANRLTGDIAYARMVAVRTSQRVRVEFTASEYRIRRGTEANPVKTVPLETEQAGMSIGVSGGTWTGTLPPGTIGAIEFDSRGILRNGGPSTINLSRNGRMESLCVTITGRVKRAAC